MTPFRKLRKHPLDVESYNPRTGLRLKIYFRELLRERLMFIGFGMIIGAAFNTAFLMFMGFDGSAVVLAFIAAMLIGTVICIANRGANPYGDLK